MRPSFFIFASERSGSTLLSALLSQHSQMYVLNDTHMFRVYNRLASSPYDWAAGKILDRAFRNVRTHVWSERSRLPPASERVDRDTIERYYHRLSAWHKDEKGNQFDGRLSLIPLMQQVHAEPPTLEDVFASVLKQLLPAEHSHKECVGEKTPVHSFLRPWLRRSYPDAAEVVLVRDPVTNVASIYKRHARSLRAAIDLYLSYWAMLSPDQPRGRLIIRYEDLITQPGTVLEQAIDHLGVDAERLPLSFSYDREHYIGTAIDPSRDEQLRAFLSAEERAEVVDRCGPVVGDLYPGLG
ncbi:MAG TPA: sulfotransferase [Euzebya sp.]|nr:sulfotransferase [Euzebya sp.]